MISIVVCSVTMERFNHLSGSVQSTIGVPYEIIRVDNSKKEFNICEAYNKGKAACKYDVICFAHEDISFDTKNWGSVLLDIFKNTEIGLVGVLGACYLSLFPEDWVDPGECEGQIIKGFIEDNPTMRLSRFPGSAVAEVAAIDGVFMCTRKEIIDKISFSDDILKGFHGYDFDISMQIRQRYKVVVSRDILLLHLSGGDFNASYFEAVRILTKKWSGQLPVYVSSYSKNEILKLKIKSLLIFFQKPATGKTAIKNYLTTIRYAALHGVLFNWLQIMIKNHRRIFYQVSYNRKTNADN